MKSKIAFLIFFINLCIIKPVYCQSEISDPESFTEVPKPSFDYDLQDAYRYVSFGVGPIIVIPNLGIGYRSRYSRFGWDAALSFSTIGCVHEVSAHLVGHYYQL